MESYYDRLNKIFNVPNNCPPFEELIEGKDYSRSIIKPTNRTKTKNIKLDLKPQILEIKKSNTNEIYYAKERINVNHIYDYDSYIRAHIKELLTQQKILLKNRKTEYYYNQMKTTCIEYLNMKFPDYEKIRITFKNSF